MKYVLLINIESVLENQQFKLVDNDNFVANCAIILLFGA